MGLESTCTAVYRDQRSDGKAKLEPDGIHFRGLFRLDIPIGTIATAEAHNGELAVKFAQGTVFFRLGPNAKKWATKIRTPRTRAEKLGLKDGMHVALLDLNDEQLTQELQSANARVSSNLAAPKLDMIFFQPSNLKSLERLTELREALKPAGAIWVVAPKGSKAVRESDVLSAGKRHGLTDTKVVSFSETLTAHKLVIPAAARYAKV